MIEEDLLNLLLEIDDNFSPPLSKLTALQDYAVKLYKNAQLILALDKNKIKGICAFYDNDLENKHAFLSLLFVNQPYQNLGIASKMMISMIDVLKSEKFKLISLKVSEQNLNAIAFYKKNGFRIMQSNGNALLMTKTL
ncbi:GNAT family N-acetyltransferase [Pontibacter sp. MBLB2868]|uniref:GNAT family N-acetyltransferase n=1 Tax=Pontibacter sp. MBLB2868 TaxID=3451555 RepID=UPI003F75569A